MDTYAKLFVGCMGITIGISLFVTHQKKMQELAYIPAQFTTQSVKTSINACLTTADMPSIVGASKQMESLLPSVGKFSLVILCSPLAQGCTELTSSKYSDWLSQRIAKDTCNTTILIPDSQWVSWLKLTITNLPFFAKRSAGIDVPTREKVKELFALTQDSLPTFLLLDDCGKVIALTLKTSDIKNVFAPFCGEANEVSCGNGQLEENEVCDDGNLDENDACTALCQPTVCGDTIINTNNSEGNAEQCDDGNTQDNDGCSSTCTLEKEFIWYCDADEDSLYSYQVVSLQKEIFPHLVLQQQNDGNTIAYCEKDLGCKYVSCRHEQGDDCDDTNNNIYSAGSYCEIDGKKDTFNEMCTCGALPTFTTQSVESEIEIPLGPPQGRCGSPDGTFINYPGSVIGGGTSSDYLRYQCSINNCSYTTDNMCFPNGGVCYYFCGSAGAENYTQVCGQGVASHIQITHACDAGTFCGQK